MEQNERGEVRGKATFAIEDGSETPLPLWRQRWFRIAAVLLVLAIAAAVVVHTQGDKFLASWYSSRAEARASKGDFAGAVADMTQAIAKTPDDLELYSRRGEFRLRDQDADLDAALADFNHVLEIDPDYSAGYSRRSFVYQRKAFHAKDPAEAKQLHAQAIADLEKARPSVPKNDSDFLNQMAYARALAGVDLDLALQEVNLALKKFDVDRILANLQAPIDPRLALNALIVRSYLDTRGYIQHLRGENQEGLADMDDAIAMHEAAVPPFASAMSDSDQRSTFMKQQDETLGVLLHHRGLIHQALGNEEQAKEDLERAEELGFNPKAGVF